MGYYYKTCLTISLSILMIQREQVREQVSQLLADLLSRLAALDKYEEFLHRVTIEASIGEPIAAVSAYHYHCFHCPRLLSNTVT